jgi:hypothetical protein
MADAARDLTVGDGTEERRTGGGIARASGGRRGGSGGGRRGGSGGGRRGGSGGGRRGGRLCSAPTEGPTKGNHQAKADEANHKCSDDQAL